MLQSSENNLALSYKEEACTKLLKYGIEDSFQIKLKKPKNNQWVAIYRSYSQFKNGGRGPIFWINPTLLDNSEEFIISILHEYGHVIAEYAWVTDSKVKDLLVRHWQGRYYNRPWDEEGFAEEFAQFVFGRFSYSSNNLKEVISTYVAECLLIV